MVIEESAFVATHTKAGVCVTTLGALDLPKSISHWGLSTHGGPATWGPRHQGSPSRLTLREHVSSGTS
eukprot:11771689-Alexandrium_andersonii.AAC.1